MTTFCRRTTALALLVFASTALASEPDDELEATMQVFDSSADVPAALSELPSPGAADVDAGREAAVFVDSEVEDAADAAADERNRGYRQELEAVLREGFLSDTAFERGSDSQRPLGYREDRFHFEEGEDVDLEDTFNDEDEVQP
jgi:hypothetical protein